ncbi:MAG: DUF4928 family protein [Chloroflexi bacterium]|nr:DUF4928 family protein [Chloroflexota bacterium]
MSCTDNSSQSIRFVYNPACSTYQLIHELLNRTCWSNKGDMFVSNLIGASLQLSFPDSIIPVYAYSRADLPGDQPGSLVVGSTVFHVTEAPTLETISFLKRDVGLDYRVYVLVPERILSETLRLVNRLISESITCQSIESFVGSSIDILSGFETEALPKTLKRLLETYNNRVDSAELDPSLLIDIPKNL